MKEVKRNEQAPSRGAAGRLAAGAGRKSRRQSELVGSVSADGSRRVANRGYLFFIWGNMTKGWTDSGSDQTASSRYLRCRSSKVKVPARVALAMLNVVGPS